MPANPLVTEALAAFRQQHAQIVRRVVGRLLAEPGRFAHLGERAEKILTAGIEFTTRDLETAMQVEAPVLLDEQLDWAHDRLPHDGIDPQRLLENLQIYAEVVAEVLPPAHAEQVNQYVQGMIAKQRKLLSGS